MEGKHCRARTLKRKRSKAGTTAWSKVGRVWHAASSAGWCQAKPAGFCSEILLLVFCWWIEYYFRLFLLSGLSLVNCSLQQTQ